MGDAIALIECLNGGGIGVSLLPVVVINREFRRQIMAVGIRSGRILKIHKKWADGFTVIWQILIIALFGGVYFGLSHLQTDRQDRNSALILLAVVIIVAAIWQAAGMAVARVHMLLEGIDLERKHAGSLSS